MGNTYRTTDTDTGGGGVGAGKRACIGEGASIGARRDPLKTELFQCS